VLLDVGFPVAEAATLFFDQPFHRLAHGRMFPVESRFAQGVGGDSRIPDRREARLQSNAVLVLDHEPVELVHGFLDPRIIHRVAQAAEGDDDVDHWRKDGAQSI
jgi:hypothetical protein